jgi:flagellar biosynthesis protein FlhA
LDASAAPLLLAGDPSAAAQSFETRDRRQGRSTGMTDTSAAQDGTAAVALSRLADLGTMLRRSDIALAVGMMAILVVLILPLPPLLLDFSLAVSITFSVLILMTSLFIHAPLEFSAFPTVLLIATMLRLALNLASTRLILARRHEGTDAAGHVIEAFGRFVMAGNFVIGIIVFTILVIASPKSRRASTSTACRASRWRSTPTSTPVSSTRRRRGGGARIWKTNPVSSARWTAPRSSCAATPSPACSWC